MKVVITGATGLIGQQICTELKSLGHSLTIFSRNSVIAKEKINFADKFVSWDFSKKDKWINELEGADAVIHLAGANIFGRRWSTGYKKIIYESRILSTNNLVEAFGLLKTKPKCFICSSAVGYYGDSGNILLDEDSRQGSDFLAQLCRDWEEAAKKAEIYGIRRVSIRTGIVLDKKGGALKQMLIPFRLFAGGPLGNGKQWFPWIHIADMVNIYLFVLNNNTISGALNAVSPNVVTMNDFTRSLGKVLKRPHFFKIPKFILKAAVGKSAEAITESQRVIPAKLIKARYKFRYEDLEAALLNLLK